MSAPLRDLLSALAEEQPAVRVGSDLYARGVRARRRGAALRVGATVAVVGLVAGLGVPVVAGSLGDGPVHAPAPATSEAQPAMPARLFAVPERLAPRDEGGYRWHDDVRADGLAVGPTAAILSVNGGAVMAVSAIDGAYRGLDLPGFDEGSYFRFEGVPVALSPDGTRLAWTWNPDVITADTVEGAVETGVRIADLETGEVTDVDIPSEYGVYAHGFGWSPDGRFLAYELQTVTSPDGEVRGSRSYRVERLDTTTGERVLTPLPGVQTVPGVSNDGAVAVSGGGYNGVWWSENSRANYQGPFESIVWSPSGKRTALASSGGRVAVGDKRGVEREVDAPSHSEGRARVLGWPDDTGFVVLDEQTGTLERFSADLEDREVLVRADGIADLYQLSVAVELLAGPTRDTPAPDWPVDWASVSMRGGLALGVLLLVATVVGVRRRRP